MIDLDPLSELVFCVAHKKPYQLSVDVFSLQFLSLEKEEGFLFQTSRR